MNKQPQQKKSQSIGSTIGISLLLGFIILGFVLFFFNNQTDTYAPSTNEFITLIEEGKVKTVYTKPLTGNNYQLYSVYGEYIDDRGEESSYKFSVHMDVFNNIVHPKIMSYNVPYAVKQASNNTVLSVITSLLPFVLIAAGFIFLLRSLSSSNSKAFDFAKSRARLTRDKTVSFNDVAGCDEEKEELVEIVDFLKNPKKYVEIGARIPKGVLLSGAPGTGKTLLAKAVAGEANVPFFTISGSEFVEMYVGLGASRVRDLFKVAKENSPCIIFIDEIDAVGRQRGTGLGGGHDEREQTLNQLLVEMDGFGNNSGIIIMAATNRPDVLDPALLRPGRFDRQILVSAPDVIGREAILKIHGRNKVFAKGVKFSDIAQRTPGFTGAEIENLLNEAALLAARDNRKKIELADIDEAVDRVLMGPAKKSRKFSEKERNMVAHHEAGHAIIGLKLNNADIVQKVTIIPRGVAGGYALMLPEEETFLETKQSLLDRITGLLGGRVSEEVNFNEISTGAYSDFKKSTKIARAMVTEYGMSPLGPIQYESSNGNVFLGRDYFQEKNFSDTIAHEIDKEVRYIIDTCYEKAKQVINENLELLKVIAKYLLEIETLNKNDIYEINETGTLKWWEDKKLRDAEEKKQKELEEEALNNNEESEIVENNN